MAQPLRPNRPDEQIPGARLLSSRIRHWLSVYSAIKIVPTQKNLSGFNQRAAKLSASEDRPKPPNGQAQPT
jgi:hypothetical protein